MNVTALLQHYDLHDRLIVVRNVGPIGRMEYLAASGEWRLVPQEAGAGLPEGHLLSLERTVMREVLSAVATLASQENLPVEPQSTILGRFEAQSRHLEDLRFLLKIRKERP